MAYNERDGLRLTVEELLGVLRDLQASFELFVIDDGSSDGTGALADELALEYPALRVIHHPENRGIGEVYRTGFREARGEWLTFFPADGEVPANCLGDFLAAMPGHDMLLGLIPPAKRPPLAIVISFCEQSLFRMLFGYLPPFQGIFMIRTEELRKHRLRSRGRNWVNLKELIIRSTRSGCRWKVVGHGVRARVGGQSSVRSLPSILRNLMEVFRLRWVMLEEFFRDQVGRGDGKR